MKTASKSFGQFNRHFVYKLKHVSGYCDLNLWPKITNFNRVRANAISNHLAKTTSKSLHTFGKVKCHTRGGVCVFWMMLDFFFLSPELLRKSTHCCRYLKISHMQMKRRTYTRKKREEVEMEDGQTRLTLLILGNLPYVLTR